MVLAGVDFWYDNYGLWPWQAKPRPKTDSVTLSARDSRNPITGNTEIDYRKIVMTVIQRTSAEVN